MAQVLEAHEARLTALVREAPPVPALADYPAAERRRATERALEGDAGDLIRALGDLLAPGEGVAAVLVSHVWAATLDDAVARMGGSPQADGFVEAATLAELGPQLVSSARSP